MAKPNTTEPKPILATCGDTGLDRQQGVLSEEWHKDLRGDKALKVWREIKDGYPTAGAFQFAVDTLISQAPWVMKPNKSGAPGAEEQADFVSGALEDMEDSLGWILKEFMTALPFGWAYLETTFKMRKGQHKEPRLNSEYNDARKGWRNWSIRSQESRDRWEFDDEGRVVGYWQQPPAVSKSLFIPIDRALHIRFSGSKGNPEGQSAYRSGYSSYYFSKRLKVIEAIGHERNLAGLPVMELPAQLLAPGASDEQITIKNNFEDMVKKIRNDEFAGLVIPHKTLPNGQPSGYEFNLVSSSGKNNAEIRGAIDAHDLEFATTLFIQFLKLGAQGVGSLALSSDMTSFFGHAMGALTAGSAEVINKQAIPHLMEINNVPRNLWPYIEFGDIEKQKLTEIGAFVQQMVTGGVMRVDEPLENWARSQVPELEPIEPSLFPALAGGLPPGPGLPAPDVPIQQELPLVTEEEEVEIEAAAPTSMSAQEAADHVGVSRAVIMRAINMKQLPGAKVGGRHRVMTEDLITFMRGQQGGV